MDKKAQLIPLYHAAIDAVSGRQSVLNVAKTMTDFKPNQIIAIGKAAADMTVGALEVFAPCPALVVTKYRHRSQALLRFAGVTVIEAGHPLPDDNSLKAGRMLLETVSQLAAGSQLLVLVSGGASALAECLPEEISLNDWQALTEKLIGEGLTIAQINQQRKQRSLIKDGRLLSHVSGVNQIEVVTLAISDVQGDDIAVIGSGIGDIHRLVQAEGIKGRVELIATNTIARQGAQIAAHQAGFQVRMNSETLYDDVFNLAANIGELLRNAQKNGQHGVYLFGGEPTIKLPDNPGNGGRNQSLALALAKEIAGVSDITILVAGTDGTDGPTDAAGGIVDGTSFNRLPTAQSALDKADAGTYLRQTDDIFITGPTGTNVMDLVIAIVG